MMGKELLERKPVSLAHVRMVLEGRDLAGKEPSYEQTQTLEYATKFSKIPTDKAETLLNNLMNIDGITEEVAVKLVDFLPEDMEAAKAVLTKVGAVSDATLSEAMELVKKYAPSA